MIFKNNPEEFQNYLSDASNFKGFANSIYFPANEEEIAALLKKFNNEKTHVTISGNGTGLTGGRVPEGGVILSLEKLNQILELNKNDKYICVQPGVVLKDLQKFVEAENLFYPPDPTERNCFIGATVATNSSGAKTFKYGPTRKFVIGLKIILASGEKISLERGKIFANGNQAKIKTESGKEIIFEIPDIKIPATKNAAGYYCKENMDLIDLFIGSEGTLGVITEIKLKLIDLPKNVLSCIAFFQDENCALDFIDEARIISKKIEFPHVLSARALEFFDVNSLRFLKSDYPNIPANSKVAVLFEQDFENNEDLIIQSWLDLLKKNNCHEDSVWIGLNKIDQEKFHVFRHTVAIKVNEFIAKRNLKKVGTDNAVPVDQFRLFYFYMKNLVKANNLNYVVYGHFGDCHPHLNILPENESEYITAKSLYRQFCEKAVALNGTVSAEHGIGKLKRDYLLLMYGEDNIKKMASLKTIFDKNRILNIGNIFDEKYLENI